MNLTLTDEERDYLLRLLHTELGTLKVEIHRTETSAYKEELRVDENTLLGLIGRLETGSGSQEAAEPQGI